MQDEVRSLCVRDLKSGQVEVEGGLRSISFCTY